MNDHLTASMAAERWLVPVRRESDGPTLVAVPFLGGGGALFNPWRKAATSLNVVAVRLPGRESRLREPLISDFDELRRRLACEVVPALPDGPLAFFGYCTGAIVAHELACLAVAVGRQCAGLFVWDCDPPRRFGLPHQLSERPREALRGAILDFGGIDPALVENDEMMALVEPVLRADLASFESYSPTEGPALKVPIWAGGGRDDDGVVTKTLFEWHEETTGRFTLRLLPGLHFLDATAMLGLLDLIGTELA